MGILGFINRVFRGNPYVFKLKIVQELIQLTVSRNQLLVSHEEIIKQNNLPTDLLKFLRNNRQNNGHYFLSLPHAMRLNASLHGQTSEFFHWEASDLDDLKVVSCPSDFKVYWQYITTSQTLSRRLVNADSYLGEGWFLKEQKVWQIPNTTMEMIFWLSLSQIQSYQICGFVSQGLPKFPALYSQCDLRIEADFQFQVQITKCLKQSLNLYITSNKPDLQTNLTVLAGDDKNLLSGDNLLLGLRQKLRNTLFKIAKSRQEVTLKGYDLLCVIRDEFPQVQDHLNLSLQELQNTYPIEDAAACPLRFIMHYEMSQGIGRYYALPGLQIGDEFLPINKIKQQIDKKERFLSVGNRWIEFTSQFSQRYLNWQKKNIAPIRLAPQEIMGSYRERLIKLGLSAPIIHVQPLTTEQQHASNLIEAMRQHGLPVGIYGLQQEIISIIAGSCARLLTENKRARILWITPNRKKSNVLQTLRSLNLPNTEREGGILVTTPDTLNTLSGEWTLTVFQDIDVIASGDLQSKLLALLKRAWTISTFNSTDWHRDNNRIRRVFQVLGLTKEDIKAFAEVCTGRYTQQSESLLSRLTTPFKQIFINPEASAANQQTGDIPIPPRPTLPNRPVNPPSSLPVYRPVFQVSVSTSTQGHSFVQQARKLANYTENSALHVPFMQYWPTYDAMDKSQKKWYFYWRNQMRQGNYLPTDLSYLFVNIYEALHLVGFSDAQAAVQHLVNLWRHYRLQHYKLDGYLIDWIADFHVIHKLPLTAIDWYFHALDAGGRLTDQNVALEAWLSQKAEITTIPDRVLALISAYQPHKSKFVQQYNQDGSIDLQLRQGLSLIDQFIRKELNASLFDHYKPNERMTIRRRVFASALYEGSPDVIEVATLPKWESATQLKSSVTAILKYTENLLRKQKNFKGSLRGIEISTQWASILDSAFPPPVTEIKTPKKQGSSGKTTQIAPQVSVNPFSLNLDKVKDLTVESNEVRRLLTVDEESDNAIEPQPVISTPSTNVIDTTSVEEYIGFDINRPIDTPDHLLTDLREVAEVLGTDQTALALFNYLKTQRWEVETSSVDSLLDGEFLSIVLDRINERAFDVLGDQIIMLEGDNLIVTEDYRDELEYLLNQTTSPEPVAPPNKPLPNFENLAPEWASFVVQMRPNHWEALHVLFSGQDVLARLEGIARSSYTTVDLLIDEINGFALASIGDIVIESGDTPTVEEEDVESLRSLLSWALENQIGMN
jgi:hypothetical protein